MANKEKLSAKVLQDMIDESYEKECHLYDSRFDKDYSGRSPSDISYDNQQEIYTTLATPLKNMQMAAMKDAAANCFKDKWMDEAFPNPHQVEMCRERMLNKHMGHFYRTLVNLRESSMYKNKDCVENSGNNMWQAVDCI